MIENYAAVFVMFNTFLIEIETNLVKSEPMPWKHQSFHKPHFSNRSTSKWVVPSCSFCWDGTGCPATSLNFFRRRITSSTRTIQRLAANSTHQHSNISSYGLSYGSHVIHTYCKILEPKWTKYTKYILPETWHIFWHHLTSHPVTLSRLLVSAEAKADSMASSKDGMKLFAPVASGFLSPLASDVRSRCLQNCTAPLLPSDVPLDGHLTMRAFIMVLWCFDVCKHVNSSTSGVQRCAQTRTLQTKCHLQNNVFHFSQHKQLRASPKFLHVCAVKNVKTSGSFSLSHAPGCKTGDAVRSSSMPCADTPEVALDLKTEQIDTSPSGNYRILQGFSKDSPRYM